MLVRVSEVCEVIYTTVQRITRYSDFLEKDNMIKMDPRFKMRIKREVHICKKTYTMVFR